MEPLQASPLILNQETSKLGMARVLEIPEEEEAGKHEFEVSLSYTARPAPPVLLKKKKQKRNHPKPPLLRCSKIMDQDNVENKPKFKTQGQYRRHSNTKMFLYFVGTGVCTQDLRLAKQAHLSHTSSSVCSGSFGDGILKTICLPGLKPQSSPSQPP
jgi:hypothetical protein